MENREENWRLLDFDSSDPKMNLAVGEAVFRCRRAGLSPNTLYLWRSPDPIILHYSGTWGEIFPQFLKAQRVKLLRSRAVAGNSFFCDAGNINFAVTVDSRILKPRIAGEYRPLLSEYEFLLEGFAEGIGHLGIDLKTDNERICTTKGQEVVAAQPAWFENVLLLQGTVYVDTDMAKLKAAFKRDLTSLSSALNKNIRPDEVAEHLVQGFENKLDAVFEKKGLADAEIKLADRLYDTKYGRDKWHDEGKAPLLSLTGETLVSLYVANPPTSKCRQLIESVNRAVARIPDEVKIVLWKRGLGQEQHPMETIPPVLFNLSKANILPAIIINGELKFALEIPSESDLAGAIQNPDKYPDITGLLDKKRT